MGSNKKTESLVRLHGVGSDGGQGSRRKGIKRTKPAANTEPEPTTATATAATIAAGETSAYPVDACEKILTYSFPSRSRCPLCQTLQTRAIGYDRYKCVQYRRCLVCGNRYKKSGTLI